MSFVTVAFAAIVSMSEEMKTFGNLSTIVQTNFQKKSKGKYMYMIKLAGMLFLLINTNCLLSRVEIKDLKVHWIVFYCKTRNLLC